MIESRRRNRRRDETASLPVAPRWQAYVGVDDVPRLRARQRTGAKVMMDKTEVGEFGS